MDSRKTIPQPAKPVLRPIESLDRKLAVRNQASAVALTIDHDPR
jgi:hypothetical protein